MYGKIFESIYDGTLRTSWQALVTFQQMIVLSDADGVIDMTPHAIAGRTGIPLDILEKGLEFLEAPDPHSRTPDEDGRRIMRLDEHRPWGWMIVNHRKYKLLQDADTRREQTRERVRAFRERQKQDVTHGNDTKRDDTQSNTRKRHTDTDTDTDTDRKRERSDSPQAHRLDAEELPAEWGGFAQAHGVSDAAIALTWETFRDYWIAQPGAKGRKLDWFATWRNWVRREYPTQQRPQAEQARPGRAGFFDRD